MEGHDPLEFGHLKRCSLFGGVTDEAFAVIRPFIRVVRFGAGVDIITEGSVNDCIYFIDEGSVEILKACTRGTGPKLLATMHSGDTFGEMELIDIQRCAATVRTLEPTVTLSLSNADLYKVSKQDMKTYALLVMNLAREMSRRLRQMGSMVIGEPDPGVP